MGSARVLDVIAKSQHLARGLSQGQFLRLQNLVHQWEHSRPQGAKSLEDPSCLLELVHLAYVQRAWLGVDSCREVFTDYLSRTINVAAPQAGLLLLELRQLVAPLQVTEAWESAAYWKFLALHHHRGETLPPGSFLEAEFVRVAAWRECEGGNLVGDELTQELATQLAGFELEVMAEPVVFAALCAADDTGCAALRQWFWQHNKAPSFCVDIGQQKSLTLQGVSARLAAEGVTLSLEQTEVLLDRLQRRRQIIRTGAQHYEPSSLIRSFASRAQLKLQ